MIKKFKRFFSKIHESFLPDLIVGDHRKQILFYVSFYSLLITVFFTVFGQIPFFADRSITQLFQIGWVITIIPLLMLDYKRILKGLLVVISLLLPFLSYCLLALCFGIPSISFSGTRIIFLSSFIFVIGYAYGKYKTKNGFLGIIFSFVLGAFIYATIVYLTLLRGYDLSNQIYAFVSKNSAGPIFASAAILSYYLFSRKNVFYSLLKWGLIIFFILIIALSKNRAVLIVVPFILIPMLFFDIKRKFIAIIVLFALVSSIILVFAIPYLYQNIIVNILLNSSNNYDDISSGRLTEIVVNLQNLKPVLGNGNDRFDCMPLSFLCTYGVIGLFSLVPYATLPFVIFYKQIKINEDKKLSLIIVLLIVLFVVNSLFEDYGYFGPGTKVFILWLCAGLFTFETELKTRSILAKKINFFLDVPLTKVTINGLLLAIQCILIVTPLCVMPFPNLLENIGGQIVERLPETNKISEYTTSNGVEIISPVDSLCVGQRITFAASPNNKERDDSLLYWCPSSWIQNPSIDVNGKTGEVFAKEARQALLHVYWVGDSSGKYIRVPIDAYNNYKFNKLYISTKKFSKSFEHKENDTITLGINCTANVFYDNYYLPKIDDFVFYSTNNSVATVDEKSGLIKAIGSGICEIKGKITTSAGVFESINSIKIAVTNNTFVPVTSIDVNVANSYYQFEEFDISPIFNEGASDKNVDITIDGNLKYKLNGYKLQFLESGETSIKISSVNNPLVETSFNVDIAKNEPVQFVCETTRLTVGEKKNAEQLGLFLQYSNGAKKIVEDDDLSYSLYPFTDRAWINKNGLVNNMTTVYAVRKGNMKINLVSKLNQDVKATFEIKCSVYSASEYYKLSTGLSLVVLSLVVCASMFFTLFVNIKYKMVLYLVPPAIFVLFSSITFIIYNFTIFSILSVSICFVFLVVSLLLRLLNKKRLPLILLEQPIIYKTNYTFFEIII